MKELTIGQQKVLREITDYYDYARSSEVRRLWWLHYDQNLKYYYGDQWSEDLKKEFEDSKAFPFVVNRIEPIITTYASLQINTRKRIAFKSTTSIAKHARLAEYLNNMIYNIQTQNGFQNKSTQKYMDALIGGIGWTHFGYEPDSYNTFFYDYVDPREVYWDPDDQSQRFENSNFVCRSYYVSAVNLKQRYPEHADFFDGMIGKDAVTSAVNDSLFYNMSVDDAVVWNKGRSIRIVEVFYKKNAKYYEGTVVFQPDQGLDGEDEFAQEQYFCTFDEDFAKAKMEKGTELKELDGTQIWKGVFCSDMLLESGPLYPQIPNQKHFPLTPLCLKRNYMGMPYGVVDGLVPLSIALNYIWTKTIHGLGSKFLIMEGTSDDMAKAGPIYLEQMAQKRGIIALKNAKDAQLVNSENLLPFLFQGLQRIDLEFEQRTQLFDELKGEQTNAISGVAIQQRAMNAARTQNPLNATYEHMLFSEGQLMLDTIKGITDFKYAFNYFKDGKVNAAALDEEISTINFEIYPDIAPPFSSSNDEEMAKFEGLLNSPNPAFALSDPLFLKKLGFSETDAIALYEAYTRITQGQQEQAQQQQEQQLAQQMQLEAQKQQG